MTFPSAGCQTCKLRRVKCDETQPICRRCRKANRACHGAGASSDRFVIHSEDRYASGHSKRPRGPRSVRTKKPASEITMLRFPTMDLRMIATCYYTRVHMHPQTDPQDVLANVSNDLLSVLLSRGDCPILDLALSCISLVLFSRTQRDLPAATQASMIYQSLIRSTQSTIEVLNPCNVDTCLLSIFAMARYEDAIHLPTHVPKDSRRPGSFRHHGGAMSTLQVWKESMCHSFPATDVIRHTRRGVISSALLQNAMLPDWILDGSHFGENGLDLEHDRIVTRITNVRHRLSNVLRTQEHSLESIRDATTHVKNLYQETQELVTMIQDWKGHFPRSWDFQKHTLPAWPVEGFYSPIAYTFPTLACAAIWCRYFGVSILIASTRLKILSLHHHDEVSNHGQRSQCIGRIDAIASEFASSIPFCLQRIKISPTNQTCIISDKIDDIKPYLASLVVWPLGIASGVGGIAPQPKMWFSSQLSRLAGITGYGVLEDARGQKRAASAWNFFEG